MDRIGTAKISAVAETFSLHAEEYDRWFDDSGGSLLFDAELQAIRLLMKHLSPPFLEIGVGSGRFARTLGIRYGIDPASVLLEKAWERGIRVKMAYGENIPFRSGMFGGAFILLTLCFAARPEAMLSEAARVLKPGGGLILGIINKESAWGQLFAQKKAEKHPIYQYATFYRIEEVEKMIVMAGLQLAAYSSTLHQSPTGPPHREAAYYEKRRDAGFVCILAKKA